MDEKIGYPSPESSSTPQEASPKRSAEAAGLDGLDGKLNRKRASKACQSCRSRKVRCGVSDHGVPCHNCKLDELECIIPERKRPTRTVKRQRSSRAAISEAALRMDRSSPDSADSPSESVHGTNHCSWDKSFQNPYRTDVFASSSPPFLQQTTNEEQSAFGGDALAALELPPLGDELARWFSVIPPRVVDKMFSYLTALSQRGCLESINSPLTGSDLSQCHSSPRFSLSDQKRKLHGATSRTPVVRHCITPQPPEYARQLLGPSTPETSLSPREPPHPSMQELHKIPSILQQLLNDYAAAAGRAHALEEAIQKVTSQFTKRPPRYIGDRCPLDTYSEPPDPNTNNDNNNNKTSPLIPPPENQTAFAVSMQAVQQLEALLASGHKKSESRPQKQVNAKDGIQGILDVAATESGGREDEFQNTFDSLMDFGMGADTMFQSFNYD
ncbi:hypothetical protein EMCG_02548 [[Emmonsia] crescens]|uniref:Zn(2)-C6 fungal-type domain-containing protein n=1 Tax=[Emmonsia] crescens TaxID=73230 RepID=A0A0G2HXN0_9EURO|nr:hypothetical protein EMCG_02548 [Emmonsia crescens UAMH 3008]